MAKATATTAEARDYKPISDLRKTFKEERSKTNALFKSSRETGEEMKKHLNTLYKERLGPGYATDPGLAYYKELIDRMTHCHRQSYLDETIPKVISEFMTGFGSKPTGVAAKLLNLLEGKFPENIRRYFRQYEKDEKLEKQLEKKESDFLEKHDTLPLFHLPKRPDPFKFIDDDSAMPDFPKHKGSLPASGTSSVCGAPRTGHGHEKEPCQNPVCGGAHCWHHGGKHHTGTAVV
jgi:hypothetical protein